MKLVLLKQQTFYLLLESPNLEDEHDHFYLN